MTTVLLSFGSNLGDPEKLFAFAKNELQKNGFILLKTSSVFRNPAQDCEPGAPEFSNCAITGLWSGSPEALLELDQKIETAAGRPADHPYHFSRTLDIDILLFGEKQISTRQLTIPHAHIAERDFYLIPAAEIAADFPVPGHQATIAELLQKLKL